MCLYLIEKKLENVATDIRVTAILHNLASQRNNLLPDDKNIKHFAINDINDYHHNRRDNRDPNAGFATRLNLINNQLINN